MVFNLFSKRNKHLDNNSWMIIIPPENPPAKPTLKSSAYSIDKMLLIHMSVFLPLAIISGIILLFVWESMAHTFSMLIIFILPFIFFFIVALMKRSKQHKRNLLEWKKQPVNPLWTAWKNRQNPYNINNQGFALLIKENSASRQIQLAEFLNNSQANILKAKIVKEQILPNDLILSSEIIEEYRQEIEDKELELYNQTQDLNLKLELAKENSLINHIERQGELEALTNKDITVYRA